MSSSRPASRLSRYNTVLGLTLLLAVKLLVLWSTGALTMGGLERFALRWDGGHFIRLAAEGYTVEADYAFAPLYPAMIWLVSQAGIPGWASALIVSNTASIALYLALSRLYRPWVALFLMLFPPLPLYTTAAYSEPLSLAFLALAYVRLRREDHLGAGLLLGAAVATRYMIALIALGVLVLLLSGRRLRDALALTAGLAIWASTILAFFVVKAGTPLAYFNAEQHWQAGLAAPWDQLEWLLEGFLSRAPFQCCGMPITPPVYLVRNTLFLVAYLLGLTVALRVRGVLSRWEIAGSTLVLAITPLLYGVPVLSIPRLLLEAIFILAPSLSIVKENTAATVIYLLGSLSAIIVAGKWFAQAFFG